jgi:hypothetical protein
VLKLV